MKKRYWPKDNVLIKSYRHWLSIQERENLIEYWEWLKDNHRVYYVSGGDPGIYDPYQVAAEERDWTLFLLRWS